MNSTLVTPYYALQVLFLSGLDCIVRKLDDQILREQNSLAPATPLFDVKHPLCKMLERAKNKAFQHFTQRMLNIKKTRFGPKKRQTAPVICGILIFSDIAYKQNDIEKAAYASLVEAFFGGLHTGSRQESRRQAGIQAHLF